MVDGKFKFIGGKNLDIDASTASDGGRRVASMTL